MAGATRLQMRSRGIVAIIAVFFVARVTATFRDPDGD
jgi:hypothetical protein